PTLSSYTTLFRSYCEPLVGSLTSASGTCRAQSATTSKPRIFLRKTVRKNHSHIFFTPLSLQGLSYFNIKSITSFRAASFSLNTPRIEDVIVDDPSFLTPRPHMQ